MRLSVISIVALLCVSCASDIFAPSKEKYLSDPAVSQLVLVRSLEGSDANVQLLVKEDGRWKLIREGSAYIGREGVGKTCEGDGKTPAGDFGIRQAFGALPNPGTSLEYIQLTSGTFGCDEKDSPYYNTIIDTAAVHHECHGEDMFHMLPSYNFGIHIDYNHDNVYPEGSLIFLHCKGAKNSTSGCVAVDEDFMKEILIHADSGMKICIR